MIDYRAAKAGGFTALFEELLPSVTGSREIFENAPQATSDSGGTVGATLTVRGGTLTIAWKGGGQAGAVAGASGNDYGVGTYDVTGSADELKKARAIGGAGVTGWITYWGLV